MAVSSEHFKKQESVTTNLLSTVDSISAYCCVFQDQKRIFLFLFWVITWMNYISLHQYMKRLGLGSVLSPSPRHERLRNPICSHPLRTNSEKKGPYNPLLFKTFLNYIYIYLIAVIIRNKDFIESGQPPSPFQQPFIFLGQ